MNSETRCVVKINIRNNQCTRINKIIFPILYKLNNLIYPLCILIRVSEMNYLEVLSHALD